MSRIKMDFDFQIDSVKDEFAADIVEINDKIDDLKLDRPPPQPDLSRKPFRVKQRENR